jgi:hypothetical protein
MAFYDLSSDRALGFGSMGQIPWSSIDRWCVRHDVWGEQRSRLIELIKRLDLAYMQYQRDNAPKPTKPSINGSDPV